MAAVSGHLELLPSRQAGEPARWYAKWRDADGQHKRKLGLQWDGPGGPPPGYLTRRRLLHKGPSAAAKTIRGAAELPWL